MILLVGILRSEGASPEIRDSGLSWERPLPTYRTVTHPPKKATPCRERYFRRTTQASSGVTTAAAPRGRHAREPMVEAGPGHRFTPGRGNPNPLRLQPKPVRRAEGGNSSLARVLMASLDPRPDPRQGPPPGGRGTASPESWYNDGAVDGLGSAMRCRWGGARRARPPEAEPGGPGGSRLEVWSGVDTSLRAPCRGG